MGIRVVGWGMRFGRVKSGVMANGGPDLLDHG